MTSSCSCAVTSMVSPSFSCTSSSAGTAAGLGAAAGGAASNVLCVTSECGSGQLSEVSSSAVLAELLVVSSGEGDSIDELPDVSEESRESSESSRGCEVELSWLLSLSRLTCSEGALCPTFRGPSSSSLLSARGRLRHEVRSICSCCVGAGSGGRLSPDVPVAAAGSPSTAGLLSGAVAHWWGFIMSGKVAESSGVAEQVACGAAIAGEAGGPCMASSGPLESRLFMSSCHRWKVDFGSRGSVDLTLLALGDRLWLERRRGGRAPGAPIADAASAAARWIASGDGI